MYIFLRPMALAIYDQKLDKTVYDKTSINYWIMPNYYLKQKL